MNKHIIRSLSFLLLLFVITSCDKKNTIAPDPGKAGLSFPAQNSACTTGTVLTATQSSITFTWVAAENTDSYEITIKNLLTNSVITQTINVNQIAVTLLRNTPYSWYVTSKSNDTGVTKVSDVWKFYNSGPAIISHPPFPADGVSPVFGSNITTAAGTVNISWLGSDADNDIAGYDVYFGTATTPPLLQANVTAMVLNNVTVTPGATYYWKIVTKDISGNTSDSGVFQFKVN
ncbi:hypothetical protein KXQ82_18405 [Mucilaginibacter sp. HMF5004]|uniref:hypothetical protein n=1 Tax=Mucilaginibacter rivuli TaxID=2857527 RepID=UPI001C5FC074|nr:hypothetical protein [Mucilaginibacter rivuli]MBW4891703.1 hypothetical protein [Mucilaginibacter rivuli]